MSLFFINMTFSQGCEGDDLTASDSLSANSIKIFGYIQPEYDYNFTDGNENTFKFRRARIGVRGKVYDDFSYYFMLNVVKISKF